MPRSSPPQTHNAHGNAEQVWIYNRSRENCPALPARNCTSFWCKLRGLTFRRSIPERWGLLMVYGQDNRVDTAIHMMFVWFDLAVVWINSAGRVVDVKLAKAWRPFYAPKAPARYVLEMAAGHLHEFSIGDQVSIETTSA
jgi:uncharacterized protein